MPGLSRRREDDSRKDRLESEIRHTEMDRAKKLIESRGLPMCSGCGHVFEEKSRHCPRCDKKTMGLLKMIPEGLREEANRKAMERARR